ncbi:insulin-like growth factor-binding protein complex acid labile subunit [Ptychodera flava]|uniref:insulin-like growth factor-binding protein complex acid labile subunit n=1 Tax=Ptychodera flava TaxID=63121 RepID=UPI00396A3F64
MFQLVVITLLLMQCCQVATRLAVCKVYNMTQVDCSGRRFENVPDKLPVFVSYLDLSGNLIAEISCVSFKGLGQLKGLNLQYNELSVTRGKPFSGLSTLEYLDLEGNRLAAIPENLFSDLKNLKILILTSNTLAKLYPSSFHGLWQLNKLRLNRNAISTLPDGIFRESTQMTVINLDQNKLSCFPQTALKPLLKINEISLNRNSFRENCAEVGLGHFTALEKLMLSGCNIQDSMLDNFNFAQAPTLHDLDLSSNNLKDPDAKLPVNVTVLNVDGNAISAETLAVMLRDLKLLKVKSLNLRGQFDNPSQITNTTFKGFQGTNFQKLDLSSNYIYVLPHRVFQWLQHLTTLTIENNNLYSLSRGVFQGLDRLITLILTQNNLSNITQVSQSIADLRQLQFLHLNFNEFSGQIPPGIFETVPSLLVLDLSDNSFTSIHPNSFTSLPNLQFLDLSYNAIQYSVPHAAFSFITSLQTLNLTGNNLGSWIPYFDGAQPLKGLTHLKGLSISCLSPSIWYSYLRLQ